MAAAEQAEVTRRRPPTRTRPDDLQELADAGIDMDDVTAKLLRDGIDAFVDADGEAARGHRVQARGASSTGRPSRSSSLIPNDVEAARRPRAPAGRGGRRRPAIWRKDDDALGAPPGTPEIANRLGWLTITEPLHEAARRPRAPSPTRCVADGLTDVVLLGMGGSSLAPEVIRRSFGAGRGRPARCTCSTRPTPAPMRAVGDGGRRRARRCSSSPPSPAGRSRRCSLFKHFHGRCERRRRPAPLRRDHRPGLLAGRPGRASTASGARSSTTPTSAGATGRCRSSGSCPRRSWAPTSRPAATRAGVAEQACANYDSPRRTTGSGWASRWASWRTQGRDKLTFVVDAPLAVLRPLGRAARRRVDRQAGQGHPAGGRRAARRRRTPTATTASSCTCATPTSPTRRHDEAMAALAQGRPSGDHAERPRPGRTSGGSSSSPSSRPPSPGWVLGDQPVRPAQRAGGQGQHQPRARRVRGDRRPARRRDDDEPCRRCSARLGAAALRRRSWATSQPSDEFDAAVAELRAVIRDATKAATTFGYGPRFLHSTGQFHKGGPADGRFLQLIHDRRRRRRDTRRRLRLHHA